MKNMRNILAIILFILVAKIGMAQQEPMFSLYHQNLFLINPANTGDQDYLQTFFDTRKQWSGIEGAPTTSAFGIHDAFSDKVGLGLLISSDKSGLIDRLSGSLNYSYKLRISKTKKHSISFGLGLGFLENKIDFTDARADLSDPIIASGNYDAFAFNAVFGMSYVNNGFELGASIPQIIDNDISYKRNGLDDYEFALKRHYIFYSGYKLGFYGSKFDENMNKVKTDDLKFYIKPSVLYKMLPGTPSQLDANLVVGNNNDLWAGFTYRPFNQSYVVAAGLSAFNLGIAYAYQLSTTDLTAYSGGTHEIMISYKLKKAQEEEDKLNKDIMNLMENQKQMKSKLDNIGNDVNNIKQKSEDNNSMIEKLENDLKSELDSLRNLMNKQKSSDGSVIIEGDNDQINQLRKELDELKKYVLQITGENVVELKSGKDSNNKDVMIETPVENGCYVIIHSFRNIENAKRAVQMSADKNEKASILYNKDRKWYYIYTFKYDKLEPALEKMRETRRAGDYTDSWVHIYRK